MKSGSMPELFLLYQMGSSQDYTWYSVVAVFFSEKDLRAYAEKKSIGDELGLLKPDDDGKVLLPEPVEFVAVEATDGDVPDVELANN
jgi:hypothetical protein